MTVENRTDDQENDGKALPFNETFQEAVIGHCLVDSRFFLRCKDRLKGSWFTKGARLGIIFDQLVKGYKKYNKPIQGISELLNEPFFLQLPPEELGRYQWTLDRCLFSKDAQGGFDQEKVRKKLTGFLRVNLFKEAIEGAAQAYKTKGLEDAYEWAQFKLKELQDASFEEDQMTLSFGDAYHWLQADLEDASKGISTGSKILDMALGGGLFKGETTAILAASNSGKCLGKDTPVIMYDGTIKMVQDIRTGDLLMGPDSKPRTVLGTTTGTGQLYRVEPKNGGDPFVCNDVHVLSLKRPKTGKIVNIPVNEYIGKPKTFKNLHKLWRARVDFNQTKDLKIPPYILGIWLGDGHSRGDALTTMDSEVKEQWISYVKGFDGAALKEHRKLGSKATTYAAIAQNKGDFSRHGKSNPVVGVFREMNLYNNKHIPHEYLTSSREDRLQLLAGILDTDGYHGPIDFEVSFKGERLARDTAFLARSLGFKVRLKKELKGIKSIGFVGEYYRAHISGKLSEIPVKVPRRKAQDCKKNPETSGFDIVDIGVGEYYGFELDGDHLFLLGDFTVTHNTTALFTMARHAVMQGKKVLVVTHEDSPKKLRKKFLGAFMGISRNDLNSVGVHQDKKLVRLHLELVSKFLEDHFVYLPYNRVGQMYVEDVCAEIRRRHEDMKLRTGRGFDIVINDYPQKLKLRKRGSDDQKRTELAEVYDYFNQLQIELDVHALLAIQTNREGLKQNMGKLETKENLGMDVIGESYGIAQNMGNIITLNRGPEDKKLHTVRFSVAKSRNDLTEVTVNTRTNYGCGLTHGDPEMFDFRKVYQKSLKHMVLSKKITGGQQVLTADDVRVINKNVDRIISDSPLKPKVTWLPSYGQIDNQVKQASSIDTMLKGIETGEMTNEEQSETKSHQWALKTFAINLHQLQGSAATQDDLKRAIEPIETIEEPL